MGKCKVPWCWGVPIDSGYCKKHLDDLSSQARKHFPTDPQILEILYFVESWGKQYNHDQTCRDLAASIRGFLK